MSEHHANLERHPGFLDQFLHGGPGSRALLAKEENFTGQASQRHLDMPNQPVPRSCNYHQWISQKRLNLQPIDCWRPASYDEINLPCQQARANVCAVGHAQVESNGGPALAKSAQEMG